ncbi:(2Fe-2S)-binding protein [Simplicispira suum]|uniref:(2Fe-2S)-binding protein n=1 Tax=Simplicispira suum TaxID=2109915 RepID=A0A2S0N561_9BURK|nr:(2Fe-2S)-binding protein [Simplicispira suum]
MFKKLPESGAQLLTLFIDGQPVQAESGETVAAVLLRQPQPASRTTPVHQSPRAPFCMMGVCFECLAIIDGQASSQSCLVSVREGMQVHRQHGRRSVSP